MFPYPIQHPNVKKLCTGCFEKHLRKDCKNSKKNWLDYMTSFMEENPGIPKEFYGDVVERMEKNRKVPTLEEYKIPQSQEEWNEMIGKMSDC